MTLSSGAPNEINQFRHNKKTIVLGLRGRLISGFSIIILIFLVAVGISTYTISTAKVFGSQVINSILPTYDVFLDLNSEVYNSYIAVQQILLSENPQFKTELSNSLINIDKSIFTIDELSKSWTMSEHVKLWSEVKGYLEQLKTAELKVNELSSHSNKSSTAQVLEVEVYPLMTKISNLLNVVNSANTESVGLLDLQSKELHTGTHEIMDSLNNSLLTQYLLSVIGVIVSIIIAILTMRAVLKHVNAFRQHSSRIASGDLTQSIEIESDDEMGQLGNDLNTMTHSLATIAKEITNACQNMVTTVEEVRHTVDVQSSGASEQASSVNEITASLSEIEKSSSQTMEKAKALGESAERTREKGQQGLDAVDQSVYGMKAVRDKVQLIAQTILELSNQTQQVGEITAVVNNLAQQSKMLALNASIEAAKAGEAGKGFAVVAVEVKNLAEQSELATTQVQKILEDIRRASEKAVMVTEEGTKGVDEGTGLVEKTGEIIRNLNEVIHETTIASQQIESAVRQESAGIEQITAGMNEINQVTTSFVASVNQTTEAISNLSGIAKNLKGYVDTYKV